MRVQALFPIATVSVLVLSQAPAGSREYRSTRHPLVLTMVRCLSTDIAVADGKWELRGVLDTIGIPLPMMEGQVTLVLKRSREVGSVTGSTDGWLIEAYRYTLKPHAVPPNTPLAKRPGGEAG
jgi:hypothetical protein